MIRKHSKRAASLAVLAGAVLYLGTALAQSGLEFIPLAQGFNYDHQVRLQTKGPTEVLQAKIVLHPQGEIGWHTHPGPAVVVVTKGTLTQYHSNGCVSVHPAGTAFFEEEGHVHRVRNQSATEPVEGYATFLLPAGNPPLVPAEAPRERACTPAGRH